MMDGAAAVTATKKSESKHRRGDDDDNFDNDPLVGKIIDSSKTVEEEVRVLLGLAASGSSKPRKAAPGNSSSHQRSWRNKVRRPKSSEDTTSADTDSSRRLCRTSSQDSSKNSAKQGTSRRRKLVTTETSGRSVPEAVTWQGSTAEVVAGVGNEGVESAGGKVRQRRMSNIRKSSRRNLTQKQGDLQGGTNNAGGLSVSMHDFPSATHFDSTGLLDRPSGETASGKRNSTRGRRESYSKVLSLSSLHAASGLRSNMVKHGSLREILRNGTQPEMKLKLPVRHPSDSDNASGKLSSFAIHEDLASFGRRSSFKSNNTTSHQEQRPTIDGPQATRNSSRSLLLKPPPKDTKKSTEKRKTIVKQQQREATIGKKQSSMRKRASESAGDKGKSRLSRQRDQLRRGKREGLSTSSAELNSSVGSHMSVSTDTSSITLLSFEDFGFLSQSEALSASDAVISTTQTAQEDSIEKSGEKKNVDNSNHDGHKKTSKEKRDVEEIGEINGASSDTLKKDEVPAEHHETQTTSKILNPSAEKLIAKNPDVLNSDEGDREGDVLNTTNAVPSEDTNLPSDLPRTNRPYPRRKSSFRKGAILSFLRSGSDVADQTAKVLSTTQTDPMRGDKSSISASETDIMMRDDSSSPGSEADTLISSVAVGSLKQETLSEPCTKDKNHVTEEVIVGDEEKAAPQISGSNDLDQTPNTTSNAGDDPMMGDESSVPASEADTLVSSCALGSALKPETLSEKSGSLGGNPSNSGTAVTEEVNGHDEPEASDLSSLCTPDTMLHESTTSIGAGSLPNNSQTKNDDEGSFGVEDSPVSKARIDIDEDEGLLPAESEDVVGVGSVQEATNDGRWEASPKRNDSEPVVPMLTDNRLCNFEPISPASSVSGWSHSQFSPTGSESNDLKFDRWEAETPINHSSTVLASQEETQEILPFCIDLSNGGTTDVAESDTSHPVTDRWAANSGETPTRRRSLGAVYMGSRGDQDNEFQRSPEDAGRDLPLKQRRSLGHVTGNSMVHSIFTKEELERLEMTGDFDFGYGTRSSEHETENERRVSHISVADVAEAARSLQRLDMEPSDTVSESTGVMKETDSHHKSYHKIIARQAAVRQSIMSHKLAISALEEELEQLEQELRAE